MLQKLTRSRSNLPLSLSLSVSHRCAGYCVPGLCGASHAATVAQLWHCPQLTERIHCGTSASCCCCWRCWGFSTGCSSSSISSTSRATAAGEILRSNANLQQAGTVALASATGTPAANAAHSGTSGFAEQRLAKLELVEYGRDHAYTHRRGRHGGSGRQTASLQFGYER